MTATGRSYLQNFLKVQYIIIQAILSRKSGKKSTATDDKNSVYKAFDSIRYQWYKSGDFPPTAFRKCCQYREKGFKNKIMPFKKSTLPMKKSR